MTSFPHSSPALADPFYYLHHFRQVLDWLRRRYSDLLNEEETSFILGFETLPLQSQALLVRMISRQGELFRLSKLKYAEIGCSQEAIAPLIRLGWVCCDPQIGLDQLFRLFTKSELKPLFPSLRHQSKKDVYEDLRPTDDQARHLTQWSNDLETVYQLLCRELCDRLRLFYFGNLHQSWSEFVLSDLGIYRYERVSFSEESRCFRHRQDIEDYLQLDRLYSALDQTETADQILALLPTAPFQNPWLEAKRAKASFHCARRCESLKEFERAYWIYCRTAYPEARLRAIRMLERLKRYDEALALAEHAWTKPGNTIEAQGLHRALSRLRRIAGQPPISVERAPDIPRFELTLQQPAEPFRVERLVCEALQNEGETYYVENTLLNALFGLLCWDVFFAPLPGSFFHPYQSAPADLYSPDFVSHRAQLFNECLRQLDSSAYLETIRRHYATKYGLQSVFVHWPSLTETLLEQALNCLPATHLRIWFDYFLEDLRHHRSGMPDLIQFLPSAKGYRLIEVKAPGDRLQDNQVRWLKLCCSHRMPVAVCHVQWRST